MPVGYQLESDRAYRRLLDLIVGGYIDLDAPLSERRLSESLQIGRTPIREALRKLAREGLIEVRPARGTFVRRMSMEDIREIYEVRMGLEGTAAYLAAQKGPTPALSAYGPKFKEMIQRPSDFDLSEIHEFGAEFHMEVFRAARNGYLLEIYEPLRLRYQVALGLPRLYDHAWVRASVSEHLDILEAIEAGDGPRAQDAICHHLVHGLNVRSRIFDDLAYQGNSEREVGPKVASQ